MYAPCPCGSGKKYKFCCYQKQQTDSSFLEDVNYWTADVDDSKARREAFVEANEEQLLEATNLNRLGVSLMAAAEYEAAIHIFRKATTFLPDYYSPANNLAVCLYAVGKLSEAIRIQRKSLDVSTLENPFGLANLALLLYCEDQQSEALDCLEKARKLKPPSLDACVKVCEALARVMRHRDILDYADASNYANQPKLCFFTGVASANLGDFSRAQQDLQQVYTNQNQCKKARDYLKFLRRGEPPNTVRGNWPYFITQDLCPAPILDLMSSAKGSKIWVSRRLAVDVCEQMMNDQPEYSDDVMGILCLTTHPSSVDLLMAIAKGPFSSNILRLHALSELQKRGAVDSSKPFEFFADGKVQEVSTKSLLLNPDYQFADPLPPEWEDAYLNVVKESAKGIPNWPFVENTCLQILSAHPEHHPSRFNFCIALLNQNRYEEAEPYLWELIKQAPNYLFAWAALLQILSITERLDEAADLLLSFELPRETHPQAMVAWLISQSVYEEMTGNEERADALLFQALDIDPDNRTANKIRKERGLPPPRRKKRR